MTDHPWRDADTLRRMYWDEQKTPAQIADELGCAPRTVYTWIHRHEIPTRSRGHNVALAKASWSHPHYYTMDTGYERWETDYRGTRYRVKVHRLLAVAEFGFDAVANHHVHHKNGIRWDNRPENIELLTAEDHSRLHFEERDDIGPEIGLIAQYGAEAVLGPNEQYGSKKAAAEAREGAE